MAQTEVLLYQDGMDTPPPLIAWLDSLQAEARDRCLARLALLEEYGHELDRPHAAHLGGGIYELRVRFYRVNFRMLYFFHGQAVAVVSHGLAKEQKVPPREIAKATERMEQFKANPGRHTFRPTRGG